MKVYCGRNRNGKWKASLDREKLNRFDNVFESEVETIHDNKLYMIKTYYGFDYDYYGPNGIYDDVKYVLEAFHSVSAAKKHSRWQLGEALVKENPSEYHVTPFSIASDDHGKPFFYGDVMEDKFNMQIIKINVI